MKPRVRASLAHRALALCGVSLLIVAAFPAFLLEKYDRLCRLVYEAEQQRRYQRMLAESDSSEYEERKLTSATPVFQALPAGLAAMRDVALDPAGHWERALGLQGSTLTVSRRLMGGLSVSFYSGGCLSRWTLARRARVHNGELLLDRPVEEYCGQPFNTFYMLRSNGRSVLLPAVGLKSAEKYFTKEGKTDWEQFLQFQGFSLRPK